jgi:perosamine synthetase
MSSTLYSKLAIEGGTPVRQDPFPQSPSYGEEEIEAAVQVLRSGKFSRLSGEEVLNFEKEFAQKFGMKHAVAISSGTAALHTAISMLGIGPGDEVIHTTHSFIGTATPTAHAGAVPIFADIDPRTFNIDPKSIEDKITPRTKAIVPVHLNGCPADMDAIMDIAQRHNLHVIEDCAQAHGAEYKGRMIGTFGIVNMFSFWEDKILTTAGEGGMLVSNDDALIRKIKMMQNHGEEPEEGTYFEVERLYLHEFLGYNYRISEVQGAVGRIQLRQLDDFVERRRNNAHKMTALLSDIEGIISPFEPAEVKHAFYKFIVTLDRNVIETPIQDFVAALRAEGIPSSRRYPTPIHQQPVFVKKVGYGFSSAPFKPPYSAVEPEYGSGLPVAEQLPNDIFRLIMNPVLTDRELEDEAAAIRKVVEAYRK